LVKSMVAVGHTHEEIARKIGIRSPKTLRKHFREELDLGATDANYRVGKTLYEMAVSGNNIAATIYWDKTRCSQKRPNKTSPAPFVVALDPEGGEQ